MSVPELIEMVLGSLRRDHYADRARDFKRDERALIKAVSLYGYECFQRGWEFDAPFLLAQIMKLLIEIRTAEADIGYLPVYLSGAVRRHIGQRAEELSARAKALQPKLKRVVDGVKPVTVVEKSDTEILATVYRDLHSRRKRRAPKRPRQQDLL